MNDYVKIGKGMIPRSRLREVFKTLPTQQELANVSQADPLEVLLAIGEKLDALTGAINELLNSKGGWPKRGRSHAKPDDEERSRLFQTMIEAFCAVHPERRVTYETMRDDGRASWISDVRRDFICMVYRWQPAISTVWMGRLLRRDHTTINVARRKGLERLADGRGAAAFLKLEAAWLVEMEKRGVTTLPVAANQNEPATIRGIG